MAALPCPYCGEPASLPIDRRRKCKACREVMVPRKDTDGNRIILKLADVPAHDEAMDAFYGAKRFHDLAIALGATEADWQAAESALAAKWGRAAARDVFWVTANRLVSEAIARSDWRALRAIYWEQAWLLSQEGRDWRPIRRLAAAADCRSLMTDGHAVAEIRSDQCCEACASLAGDRVDLLIEANVPSIPAAACDIDGWCSCGYTPVFEKIP